MTDEELLISGGMGGSNNNMGSSYSMAPPHIYDDRFPVSPYYNTNNSNVQQATDRQRHDSFPLIRQTSEQQGTMHTYYKQPNVINTKAASPYAGLLTVMYSHFQSMLRLSSHSSSHSVGYTECFHCTTTTCSSCHLSCEFPVVCG